MYWLSYEELYERTPALLRELHSFLGAPTSDSAALSLGHTRKLTSRDLFASIANVGEIEVAFAPLFAREPPPRDIGRTSSSDAEQRVELRRHGVSR